MSVPWLNLNQVQGPTGCIILNTWVTAVTEAFSWFGSYISFDCLNN